MADSPLPMDPAQDLPLSAEEVRQWWARIELDRQRRKVERDKWRKLFAAYLPPNSGDVADINSNLHFRNTHLKSAEMFAQLPDLILSPLEPLADLIDPQTNQPMSVDEIVALKRSVLNKLLGRDHANVELTVKESLFDIFQTSGIAATKICYQADMQGMPTQVPTPPVPQPGAILNLQDMPGGLTAGTQKVAVNERWRWYHFSTEKLGIPSDFHSTDYDEAPYLFMEFIEPMTEQAREAYNLPPDFQPNVSRDELIISRDQDTHSPAQKKLLHGIEIWLYACYFDPTVAHTQVMRRLVLIEGLKDRAAIYRPSPYQTLQPDGRLSADSMIGNPIHPIVLRVASDTAWIPPDSAFTDPLVKIENTWMSQDTKMRDANLPRFLHSDKITTAVDKLKNMDSGQGAAIAHELMAQGMNRLIAPIPHLEHAQSDTTARTHNQKAITETLGISPNQAGNLNDTRRSATEIATIQANISVRLKAEQNTLLARLLVGIRKFDALIQRYMTDAGYITIIGQNGERRLQAFTNAHLSGRYAYDAHPDSQLTINQDARIKRFTDWVNFLAKSGYLNMHEVVREGANIFGFDAARMIKDPQPPPPPPPEQPKVSVALKAIDLGIPEVQVLLQQLGIHLPPNPSAQLADAMARDKAAQNPPHGGAANKAEKVDEHTAQETGLQVGAHPQGDVPAPAQQSAVLPHLM